MVSTDNWHMCPGRSCDHGGIQRWQGPPEQGWQCPACRVVHAPSVKSCLCAVTLTSGTAVIPPVMPWPGDEARLGTSGSLTSQPATVTVKDETPKPDR